MKRYHFDIKNNLLFLASFHGVDNLIIIISNICFYLDTLHHFFYFYSLNVYSCKYSVFNAGFQFCRTLSSMHSQMSEVRPFSVLQKSFKYLFDLLQSSEQPFEAVHAFVSDRLRSIRQDLSMQRIHNDQVIIMYEEMVCIIIILYFF